MRAIRTVTVVAAALALAACSAGADAGEAGSPTGGSGADSTTIKVGTLPIIEYAPLYIAEDQGYFEEAGLTVETQVMQNAAGIVPAVMNGQLQVGEAATIGYLNARAQNLPVTGIASAAITSKDADSDFSGLFVADESITSLSDLEGKKVAVNALKAAMHAAAAQSIALDGGDPANVEFISMPFPDMAAALERGDVDGVVVVEPFYTTLEKAGARNIGNLYTTALPAQATIGMFFASDAWLKESPEDAKKFVEAIEKAGEYAAENPDAVRQVAVEDLGMAEDVAAGMRLPGYGGQLTDDHLVATAQVMVDLGFIPEAPAAEGLTWRP
ncbi:ABC transporter substrate-binding protein [Georgenia thermotolerans]|nr:ABC transporter substrate-binding protein [Georgenia thermotolerans]